jgi:excisionase family DNA binding protein
MTFIPPQLQPARVIITSPIEARCLAAALGIMMQKWRDDPAAANTPPLWMLGLQSALHALGDERDSEGVATHGAKAERKPRGSKRAAPATVDVMTAAQILRVSTVTVRSYIADGRLKADRRGRAWRIERESVEEMEQQSA